MTKHKDADFSGYATKAGLECSDGRTIMPEAFAHMNGKRVPLVWQHGHGDPKNVLGHAILEARDDGVYAYGYFNDTDNGQIARTMVQHDDITHLSIYANKLVERSKKVFHGVIRELSLVLSGANPGAKIDYVTLQHGDGAIEVLDDEAVIYSSDDDILEHDDLEDDDFEDDFDDDFDDDDELEHADDLTVKDVYDSLTEQQKNVVNYMIGAALEAAASDKKDSAEHSDEEDDEDNLEHQTEGEMVGNIFENQGKSSDGTGDEHVISHSDLMGIVEDAKKIGSLKEAAMEYALAHGIDDIEVLFPDAQTVGKTPEWVTRRMEWVDGVLKDTTHTPFSRIKTRSADLTHDEARAKGYVKGSLKKEEFFGVMQRITTPTTVYKRQKLDRDDVVDITDFDVVVWLKAEMRVMLDEELARAVLIGDGRDVSHADKVKDPAGASEGAGIRSILHDHELYVTTVNVNIDDANSDYNEVVEAVMRARRFYKGSGAPNFYTTAQTLVEMLLSKDGFGRRRWNSIEELAKSLMVDKIIQVEVMEQEADLLGIIVNLRDYALGADKGGRLSMFDDFDIDYNQHKYLIETRVSGALTKVKSALVVKRTASASVLIAPEEPAFDEGTWTITIPTDANVDYFEDGVAVADGASVVVAADSKVVITAEPVADYHFATNAEDSWTYVRRS